MTGYPAGIPSFTYIEDVAEAWGVTTLFIQRRLRDGRFEGVKIGRRWVMTEAQILAAIETMTTVARAPEPQVYPGGLSKGSFQRRQRLEP
jgi:hypothetical protein